MAIGTHGNFSTRRQITLAGLLSFLCSLLIFAAILVWTGATGKVDRLLHDSWVRFGQSAVPNDIFIVAIDRKSLSAKGRWPWPRSIQAELLERMSEHGAKLVVIDIVYDEPSERREDDVRLGNAIDRLGRTVLPVLTEIHSGRVSNESLPVPDVVRNTDALGNIFLPIDEDGIVRRIFLKVGYRQAHWSALSLAGLELLNQVPSPLPGRILPDMKRRDQWALNYEAYIPFYGPRGTFPQISAIDIFRGDIPQGLLQDKVVFVGLTAAGLRDVVPTPVSGFDQATPGVEIHANVFAALRDGVMVSSVNPYAVLFLALVLMPLMLLVYSRAPPEWSLIGAVAGAMLPVIISFLMYRYARLWFAPLAASVPILASYLFWSRHRLRYVNRFLENEQKSANDFMPQRVEQDNLALAGFFNSASRHLPISGWRFSIAGEQHTGGEPLPASLPNGLDDRWSVREGVYSKRYSAAGGLRIEMRVSEGGIGEQIANYVDSLARVREREQSGRLSGSIERLQTNVLTLSEQLEWLRSIKAFTDTMMSAVPAGFGVWNPAGECIRANPMIYQLVLGYQERASLVDFISCLGHDSGDGENARKVHDLIINRDPWQIVFKDEARELVVSFRAVGESLAERLICVMVVDMTDIRTAERARAEMMEYLSHDLRSPLISALYLLESEADPRISQNINHSLAMMDDLLHIARADSLTESGFQPLLLNAVLDNTLDQLLPQALNRGIQFNIDTVDDDLWMLGDAASLERAFVNIVGNAIKYSPEGTEITINLVDKNGSSRLTVDDQGVGIDPGMLDQLFTRFKRDATTEKTHRGIGLGLALVSRVVGLHDGQVWASNLRVGTRITLTLPLEAQAPDSERGSAPLLAHDRG